MYYMFTLCEILIEKVIRPLQYLSDIKDYCRSKNNTINNFIIL